MRDRMLLGFALAIVACVAGIYAQVHAHDFVNLDDLDWVARNPVFLQGLSWHGLVEVFTGSFQNNWIPLTALSLYLDHALHGADAGGYLLTNVVLHAANAVLLLLVLVRMTGARWCAGFVALFFAVHPLHVESVAWVSERKDVLSGLFFMAALLAYARYAEGPPTQRRMLPVAALLAAGLLAKPMLVTLPFLLLLDYWPLRRTGLLEVARPDVARLRGLVLEKASLFAVVVAVSVVTFLVQDATGAVSSLEQIPFSTRVANALASVTVYLSQTLVPQGLAVLYPYPAEPDWQAAGGAALLIAGVSVFAVRLAREQPSLLVGWLWFLGMLVPVIGFVQVGVQAHADRYTYLPQIGLTIAFAWGAADVVARSPSLRPAFVVVGVLVLGWFAGVAWLQAGFWRDSVTLYERALAVTEGNYVAHKALGEALLERGRAAEALLHFEQARKLRPGWPEAELGFADALLAAGQPAAASQIYDRWVAALPDSPRPLASRGLAAIRQGQMDAARADLERALALDPHRPEALAGIGIVQDAAGKPREAAAAYREALRFDPFLTTAANNLAWLLATTTDAALRDPEQAVALARRAVARNADDPSTLDTLAVAYAAAGRFEEATQTGERALQLAEQLGATALAEDLRQRLAGYRAGRAYPAS